MCDIRSPQPTERPSTDTPVRVKLANYDAVLLNSSGGKDSQTMLRFMVQSARDQNYPLDKLVVVHADPSPRVEWDGTTELAREQADHYGLRFVVVRHPRGDLLDYVRRRSATLKAKGSTASPWPSSGCRWCTSDLKRGPVATVMTRLTNEVRATGVRRRVRLLNCLGLRAAESPARSKLKPFKLDRAQTNGRRVVHTYLPLFGWGADRVWADIQASGVRHHPACDLGLGRLSCALCIFAPRAALLLAGKHNRAKLEEYVRVEQEVGSRFRVGLSLVEVRDALDRGEEPGPVSSWEMP